jgi:hypothetical protein
MLYRLEPCQSHLSSENNGSEELLYRGVSYSSAATDLKEKRLFFSQAISHNISDESQDGETFRTQSEWMRVREDLQLNDGGDNTQTGRDGFFERGDQYARSCYFISCWSFSKSLAIQFADKFSEKALFSIKQGELISAFHTSVEYWNSLQPSKYGDDGFLNLDWEPRYIGHAYGSVKYVKPSEPNRSLPFRLARGMRLPNSFEHEREWRIALDISHVPCSISTAALLTSDLMPSHLTEAMRPTCDIIDGKIITSHDELKPMIKISTSNFPNYERGLWLNNCDLGSCSSFQFHRL